MGLSPPQDPKPGVHLPTDADPPQPRPVENRIMLPLRPSGGQYCVVNAGL
jgi:hypothetical protein